MQLDLCIWMHCLFRDICSGMCVVVISLRVDASLYGISWNTRQWKFGLVSTPVE